MGWLSRGDNAPTQKYGDLGKNSTFRFSPTGYECKVTNVAKGVSGKIRITYTISGAQSTDTISVYPTESCYL